MIFNSNRRLSLFATDEIFLILLTFLSNNFFVLNVIFCVILERLFGIEISWNTAADGTLFNFNEYATLREM